MHTDLDFTHPSLFGSVISRPAFNQFQRINGTQAWSLLLTAGREDKSFGLNAKTGYRFTIILFASLILGILAMLIVQIQMTGS